jgi:zinc protease
LGEYATLHTDPHLINTRTVDIASVTAEQVAAAMSAWFGSDRRATLVYRRLVP